MPARSCSILLSLPYTLLNNIRPLIGATPYTTRIESILTTDRTEILLANDLQRVQDDYAEAAAETYTQACTTVGLIGMQDEFPEYPFWWILHAPQSGIRIESLSHSVYTEKYVDPSFEPCLIICAGCDLRAPRPGYTPVGERGPLRSGGTSDRTEANCRRRARVRGIEWRAARPPCSSPRSRPRCLAQAR